jgi:peptidoglycan-N-acetylglucosamine deacetylase
LSLRRPHLWRLGACAILAGLCAPTWVSAQPTKAACASSTSLAPARIVEIDTRDGPLYGDITKFSKQPDLLAPKEVILTFDDGPMPWITKSILDTLDHYCAKATFFSVGRMAMAYPDSTKDVMRRGHTLGTHTWSHPMHMRTMRREQTADQMDRGFAAVAAAAGQPIAPFFRFPGLSDNAGMLAHLQSRGVATFTVDVVSNDSFIADPGRLTRETLAKIEARRGGILLFHDIKASTARALPNILSELKARGYRVVHMTAKAPHEPQAHLLAEYRATLAKAETARGGPKKNLVPFYGSIGPERNAAMETPLASTSDSAPITILAPAVAAYDAPAPSSRDSNAQRNKRANGSTSSRVYTASDDASTDGWSTTVKRPKTRASKPPKLRERTQY